MVTQADPANTGPAQESALRRKMAQLPKHKWKAQLVEEVRRNVRQICQLDANQPVPPSQGFTELGLDSLMAVELKDRLQQDLGIKLRATISFDYPTIDALAKYVGEVLEADLQQVATLETVSPSAALREDASTIEMEVGDIADLSEEEAEILLLAKLQAL
jgi:acyl carrier protein